MMLEIPQNILVKYLRKFAYLGELSFKIDELTNVIEFSFEQESKEVVNEKLKKAYQDMNAIQLEIIDNLS